MPRAERLEYEDAYYHVMNRGRDRGRVKIFHSPEYFQVFLQTLEEAVDRFGIVVHAYCLMTNHYHLLIQTPNGNISRAMRHVNGVYTQRHNRVAKCDGPIFRGRFKSILIDSDAYLLQLSRYIHRNPVETKKPMVEDLTDYIGSSYPAYVNQIAAPNWLEREQIYGLLGSKQRYSSYAKYIAQGNSEQLIRFYSRCNIASVIGEKEFVEWLRLEKVPEVEQNKWVRKTIPHGLTLEQITSGTASFYKQPIGRLRQLRKGRYSQSDARKMAIYLCQHLGDHTLKSIGDYFGLGHTGSVSHITCVRKRDISQNVELKREVEEVCRFIINQVT